MIALDTLAVRKFDKNDDRCAGPLERAPRRVCLHG